VFYIRSQDQVKSIAGCWTRPKRPAEVIALRGGAHDWLQICARRVGVFLLIFGTIWVLQGLSVSFAPKSFMTSDINWTYRGVGLDIAGLLLAFFGLSAGWRNLVGGFGALMVFIGAITLLLAYNVLPIQGMAGNAAAVPRGVIALVIGIACTVVSVLGGKSAE
jgi:hypothetical protein